MRDFSNNLKVKPAKLHVLQTAACKPQDGIDLRALAEEANREFLAQRQNWVINRSMEEVESEYLAVLSKNCNMADAACLVKLMTTLIGLKSVQVSAPQFQYQISICDFLTGSDLIFSPTIEQISGTRFNSQVRIELASL